jgi:1-phosphofructokinase family hexose kinase
MASDLLCLAPNPSVDRLAIVTALAPGEIHRPESVVAVAGGKGLNVARAAAQLGGRPSVVALVGGHAGAWIAEQLAQGGIDGHLVWHDGETRTCLSVRDRDSGLLTEFYEDGPRVSEQCWQEFEVAAGQAVSHGGLVTASGSVPAGAPLSAYASLCASVRSGGGRVLLDTRGAWLALALPAGPWLAKVNADEAHQVTGIPVSAPESGCAAALRICELGAANAIVTLGTSGAVLATGGRTWRVGATSTLGPYPVGCGDTMLGAIALRLADGASLEEAAQFGAAAAAANAMVPGAGELDVAAAKQLESDVRIERMG